MDQNILYNGLEDIEDEKFTIIDFVNEHSSKFTWSELKQIVKYKRKIDFWVKAKYIYKAKSNLISLRKYVTSISEDFGRYLLNF